MINSVTAGPKATAGDAAKMIRKGYYASLIDPVREQGGAVGQAIAAGATLAVDKAKEIRGRHAKAIHRLLRASGGMASDKTGLAAVWDDTRRVFKRNTPEKRAIMELSQQISHDISDDARNTVFQLAVEGKYEGELSPKAQEIVQGYRDLVIKGFGKEAEDLGILQSKFVKTDDGSEQHTVQRFKASEDGKLFVRSPTIEYWDIVETTAGRQALADIIADMNGLEPGVVREQFERVHKDSNDKQAAFELGRQYKEFPSHIDFNGREYPLIHSDPFGAIRFGVEQQAERLGYVAVFGQNLRNASEAGGALRPPPESPAAFVTTGADPTALTDDIMRQRFIDAGGVGADYDTLIKSLNGRALYEVDRMFFGSRHPFFRLLQAASSMRAAAGLTASHAANIPESVGATLAFGGLGNWWKAHMRLSNPVGLIPGTKAAEARADLMEEMMTNGFRQETVVNLIMTDPSRRPEQIAQIFGDTVLRLSGVTAVNDFNEVHAAVTAAEFIKRLQVKEAGTLRYMDEVRLRALDFNSGDIDAFRAGTAPDTLFQSIGRRFAPFTQGTDRARAQRSPLLNSRIGRLLFAYQGYNTANMRQFDRIFSAWADTQKAAGKSANVLSPSFARVTLGLAAPKMVSGFMGLSLRALIKGGPAALAALWVISEDEVEEVLWDTTLYAMFGGPVEMIYNAAADRDPTVLLGMSMPYSMARDMWNYAEGRAEFRDMGTFDATVKLLVQRPFAISRPIRTWLFTAIHGGADPATDAAISAAWEWKDRHDLMGDIKFTGGTDPFRTEMKKAYRAFAAGDPDAAYEAIAEAAGVKGEQLQERAEAGEDVSRMSVTRSLKASLRARSPFRAGGKRMNPQQLESLRAAVGEDNFTRLYQLDATLNAFADSL